MIEKINVLKLKRLLKKRILIIRSLTDEIDMMFDDDDLNEYTLEELEEIINSIRSIVYEKDN